MRRILNIVLYILSGLFWSILMLFFSDVKMTLLTIIAAVLHECGHLFCLAVLKKSFSLPRLVSSGFRIKTNSELSYKEEILICFAGPLCNILIFVFFIPYTPDFAIINLATALSNLLPLPDYDGYKITCNTLSLIFNDEISCMIMPYITLTVCAAAVFLSLFLILTLNGGYWIFFIFFIVLLRQIFFFQNRTKNENM